MFRDINALIAQDEEGKLLARLAEIENLLNDKAVKEELSVVDLDTAHKITDTLKNILKEGAII